MVEYAKINCKLTNVQLNKLKKAVKSNEGLTLYKHMTATG